MAARKKPAPKAKAAEVKPTAAAITPAVKPLQQDAPTTGAEGSGVDQVTTVASDSSKASGEKAPEKKATDKKAPKAPPAPEGKAPALLVKSRAATGFRRCGMRFTPEGLTVALEALTAEQVSTLKSDANLIVTTTGA